MRSDWNLAAVLMATDHNQVALAAQQPWADLIVGGRKTVEVRSTPVQLRGLISIYASKRLSMLADVSIIGERSKVDSNMLPRGCLVGAVKIIACRLAEEKDAAAACVSAEMLRGKYAWELSDAVRFASPIAVERVPYGIWFYPFREREAYQS